MVLRYRVGAGASTEAGHAMANYVEREALGQARSLYYAANAPDRLDERQRTAGGLLLRDAETFGEVRPDIDPRLAARLGIDPTRALSVGELGHLLNGLRADGERIEGKQYRSPSQSLAAALALDPNRLPTHAEIAHVLAGRKADGTALSEGRADGLRQRFLEALGVPRTASVDEIGIQAPDLPEKPLAEALGYLVATGMTSYSEAADTLARAFLERTGDIDDAAEERLQTELSKAASRDSGLPEGMTFRVNAKAYANKIAATHPPVAFIDLSFHPDKSVSVAYAMAESPAERGIYRAAVADAAADTMAYFERELGHVRRGHNGRDGTEPGTLAWYTVMHDTARPVLETVSKDNEGRDYTEFHSAPRIADPHLHPHVLCLNAVMTEGGHIGALDLDQLRGKTKQLGALFHVHLAERLRSHGMRVHLDRDTGAAVLSDVDCKLCKEFSRRRENAQEAAREYAKEQGLEWDSLSKDRQIGLLHRPIEKDRLRKDQASGDFAAWQAQGRKIAPDYRSPLRRQRRQPELGQEQRVERAVAKAEPLIVAEFQKEAVIPEAKLRELLIRGFVETGIGNPARDIEAAFDRIRTQGISIDGQRTGLIFGSQGMTRGKTSRSVTTALAEAQEREAIEMAKSAHADRTAALEHPIIERHVAATAVSYSPEQRGVIEQFATGGRLEVAIGAGGVGKTTLLKPLVAAWREAGRDVHGVAQKWSHATALAGAGIEHEHCLALDKLLHDARKDRVKLTRESVIVVNEVSRIGVRQWHELLQLRERTGAQIVALGDPRQCSAIERGNVIDLVGRALPEAIPQMLHSIRHRTERERQITAMFREGVDVERALRMKEEDKAFELVAGGTRPTVERIANLWAERRAANAHDPDWSITLSAPTHADIRLLNDAIRAKRRELGEIGQDVMVIRAVDKNAKHTGNLALAVGDRVRAFDRVFDAGQKGKRIALASNGDILEIRQLSERGMVVRNEEGREGLIEWRRLMKEETGNAIRLTHGYCHTIDSIQGVTSNEHISAYPSGTASAPLGKHYTALSRQRDHNWLVVNESAERQRIYDRARQRGPAPVITYDDVRRAVAENMERMADKSSAVEFLSRASGQDNSAVLGALEPGQHRQRERALDGRERISARVRRDLRQKQSIWENARRRVAEIGQSLRQGFDRMALRREHERHGPSMSL